MPTKKKLLFLVKLVVSVGLLLILFSWINFGVLWQTIRQVNPVYLAIAVAILISQSAISTLKWQVILAHSRIKVSYLFLWKTYLIGGFLGLFLPTSFGGDVYRIYATRHSAGNLRQSTASVMFERLTGLFALITLSFIGSLFLPQRYLVWGVTLVYILSVGSFLLATSTPILERLNHINNKWLSFPVKILESFRQYRTSTSLLWKTLALSFWFQTNVVIVSFLHTRALGMDVAFTSLLMIIPLIFLTEALPISIHGLGIRESAFAFFFVVIGQTQEQGLAVAFFVVLLKYLLGTIGGVLLFLDGLQAKQSPSNDAQAAALQED